MNSLTISEAAPLIQNGSLDPVDLVDDCLRQIEQHEVDIQAWVCVYADEARQQAKRACEEIRGGNYRGPLHGIPLGIKDIIDVQGWPTQAGSPLRVGHRADEDAHWVAQLRKAGAVFLGKTVTTQFACFDPPATKNPWNLNRTPGGSSSGSAAAVAMRMCMAALGSQTGGSITRPASFCGIAGLKPSFASAWLKGVVPISGRLDHVGPMGRCIADLDLIMRASGWDSAVMDCTEPPALYVWDSYFHEQCDSQVAGVTNQALDRLGQAGAKIRSLSLPRSFDQMHPMHRRIMAFDTARHHREDYATQPQAYGPNISSLIEEGLALNDADYQEALAHQDTFSSDLRAATEGVQWVVMPSTVTPAPTIETTGDPAFNSPWSYCGWETISVPCGLSENGLPCSLQFLAGADGPSRRGAVQWCETQLHFSAEPQRLSSDS